MKVDTWMPLYVADLLADTLDLSTEQFGAYLLLLCHYWRKREPPPDDDRVLATITRTNERWNEIRAPLEVLFDRTSRPGSWVHGRLELELGKALAKRKQKIAAGKASAEQRARERIGQQNANEKSTNVEHPLQRNGQRNVNPSPSPTTPPNSLRELAPPLVKRVKGVKIPMPKDFGVSDSVREWAKKRGYAKLEEHLESFRSKCEANGYAYVCWDSAFKEAIRADWAGIRRQNGGAPDEKPWFIVGTRIRDKGIELGMGDWSEEVEPFVEYRNRVFERCGLSVEEYRKALIDHGQQPPQQRRRGG